MFLGWKRKEQHEMEFIIPNKVGRATTGIGGPANLPSGAGGDEDGDDVRFEAARLELAKEILRHNQRDAQGPGCQVPGLRKVIGVLLAIWPLGRELDEFR